MLKYFNLILLFCCFTNCSLEFQLKHGVFDGRLVTTKTFMFWPNGTVPFYINPDHFDHEQATAIMTCLSMIAFKTCIKFAPVMTVPEERHHVMTFINPDGIRRCRIETGAHSNYEPHIILLGYDCLKEPEINMIVLRALGLPFEHNRMSRDVYINVMIQNVDPSYVELFTKDSILPPALRILPYDLDSVMHFGERDYSKNGHRTIIFKNRNFRQNRNGLTPTDIKKIDMIYGPECRTRDRAEKVALCQSYPSVVRRKREITEPPANKSLRVNPNITPPAHIFSLTETENVLKTKAVAETQKETQRGKEIEGGKEITERKREITERKREITERKMEITERQREITEPPENKSLSVTPKNTQPPLILALVTEKDTLNKAGQQCNKNLPENLKNLLDQVYQLSNLALKTARIEYCNVSRNSTAKLNLNFTIEDDKCFPDVLGILKNFKYFSEAVEDDAASNLTEFCQNSETIDAYQKQCQYDGNAARCLKTFKLDTDKEKADDKISQTALKSNRRKREVTTSETEATTKTEEMLKPKEVIKENTKTKRILKDKKIEVPTEISLKEKVKAIRKDRLKEIKKSNNIRTSEKVKPTSTKAYKVLKENKKVKARKFSEKRYQIQNRDETAEDSDITLEKDAEIEPEISLKKITKEPVEVSLEIKSKLVDNEEKTESVEETKGKEDGEDVVDEVSEEEIHKKADENNEEEDSEEKPQNRQKVKQRKRKIPKTVELTKLNKEFYTERRWPDGDVIYVIADLPDYDLQDLRARLSQVDSILRQKTCVKLREVDAKEAPGFDDYMILDNSPDYVTGKVGGKQNFGCIELFEGGQHKQHTAMMVMAMLGFYFEVSRHDRDRHIRVHNRHIRPDKLHHFEKLSKEATLNIPYDYKSATHPSHQFWRKIGKTGLATVATYKDQDPTGSVMQSLGQNSELLSELDILKINSVYGVDCFKPKSARIKKESGRMQKEEELLVIQ